MSWIALALVGQFFWASGNLFDKYLLSRFEKDIGAPATGALILFSAIAALILVPIFAIIADSPFSLSLIQTFALIGNGALVIGWITLYFHALEKNDASVVVPLFQFIPVFGYLFGVVLLGEFLSLNKIAYGLLIITGALLLTIEFKGLKIARFAKMALILMLGAAFLEALSNVVFKFYTLEVGMWEALTWTYAGMAITGVSMYIVHKPYRLQFTSLLKERVAKTLSLNGVNEIFDALGNIFFLIAITLAPVAIVQTSMAFQPIFVLIGATLLSSFANGHFNERSTGFNVARKIAAIALIVLGSIQLYS